MKSIRDYSTESKNRQVHTSTEASFLETTRFCLSFRCRGRPAGTSERSSMRKFLANILSSSLTILFSPLVVICSESVQFRSFRVSMRSGR